MKLFLDMDGVLVDFLKGIIAHFNLDCTHDDVTSWNQIINITGLSVDEFWQSLPANFFETLEFYPHAMELIAMVKSFGFRPCLLTSPPWGHASGKQNFIQHRLPEFFKDDRYLIGPAKHYVARGNILIDDYDANIDKWREHKGIGITFPQPWNRNKVFHNNEVIGKIEYVGSWLEDIKNGYFS